jgi:hypothetical protein
MNFLGDRLVVSVPYDRDVEWTIDCLRNNSDELESTYRGKFILVNNETLDCVSLILDRWVHSSCIYLWTPIVSHQQVFQSIEKRKRQKRFRWV